jgi:hypothetical protein
MKTAGYVVDQVYGLLTSVRPLFKHKHPDGVTLTKFAVVNTLGVPADPVQDVEINVNCYAKDIDTTRSIPDIDTIEDMTEDVIDDLHDVNKGEFDIEFVRGVIIREEKINMHFANLRFRLTFLNN